MELTIHQPIQYSVIHHTLEISLKLLQCNAMQFVDSYPGPGGGCSHVRLHPSVIWREGIHDHNVFLQRLLEVIDVEYIFEIAISSSKILIVSLSTCSFFSRLIQSS